MTVRHLQAPTDSAKDSVVARRDSIRTPPVRTSPAEDKKASLRVIKSLIRLLFAHSSPHIADISPGALQDSTQTEFERFKLHVRPLDLGRDGTSKFFVQMDSQEIVNLPLGPIPAQAKKNMDAMRNVIDHGSPLSRQQKPPLRLHVQELAYYFGHTTDLPRMGPKEQVDKLAFFTGWKLLNSYSPRYNRESLSRLEAKCTDGWICRDTRFPHFKAAMWTGVDAIDQQPLRAEVVTILGIMAERHEAEELHAHTIIPVMLISFVGPGHARILLAHFDQGKLQIEMSSLLPIYTDDNTNMDTLIRWWAAKANPGVPTTKPLLHGVENLPPAP
ncbi:hypothetical protein BJY00DRAFT_312276 [Aspergillus carlsbadensis]|nr:hypothetical protein BJY00DRAFT_312276 [Aspergillus carlsbadensis]